jgi:hypothetical protein
MFSYIVQRLAEASVPWNLTGKLFRRNLWDASSRNKYLLHECKGTKHTDIFNSDAASESGAVKTFREKPYLEVAQVEWSRNVYMVKGRKSKNLSVIFTTIYVRHTAAISSPLWSYSQRHINMRVRTAVICLMAYGKRERDSECCLLRVTEAEGLPLLWPGGTASIETPRFCRLNVNISTQTVTGIPRTRETSRHLLLNRQCQLSATGIGHS